MKWVLMACAKLVLKDRQGMTKVVGASPQRGKTKRPLHAGSRIFVVRHGFLLIIRGFVKVAVSNAGVIQA